MIEDKKIGRRTVARLLATQILFQYHFHNKNISLDELLNDTIELYIKEECDDDNHYKKMVDVNLTQTLINGVEENLEEIDAIITENLKEGNTIEGVQGTVKEIVRLAIFELQHMKETPTRIIINEYVNLTAYFGEESNVRFANGILDTISKKVR